MLLATVLLVLFADHAIWNLDKGREQLWSGDLALRWVPIHLLRWLLATDFGIIAILLVKMTVVYLLVELMAGIGWPLEFLFSAGMLLMTLGPINLDRQINQYLEISDPESRSAAFHKITGLDINRMLIQQTGDRVVAQAILRLALPRLFGTLFWFILLGPAGAIGFQLLYWLPAFLERLECTEEAPFNQIRQIRHWADWVPARMLALSYGIAGSFEPVARAWQCLVPEEGQQESEALLETTGTAALNTYQTDLDAGQDDAPPVIEDALALVWRALSLWLLVISVIALVTWIA